MHPATSSIFQPSEIRIVEASAGSGKTFALAKRYVQLLLTLSRADAKALSRILAITFTNKAAYEMKARVLEFLKNIALQRLSSQEASEILKPLAMSSSDAASLAASAMDNILSNYNYFQVQTIDKFTNALLSASAFRIGLTAKFRIRTRARDYLQLSLDRLIERSHHASDDRRLLESFLHHYLFLENRLGWFPKDDILNIQETLFGLHNNYGLPFAHQPFAAAEMFRRKSAVLSELRRLRDECPPGVNKTDLNTISKFLDDHPQSFDLDDVKQTFSRDLKMNKDAVLPKHLEESWRRMQEDLRQLCEDEAAGLFSPYVDIFERLQPDFQHLCAKADIVFLSELNRKAARLFEDEEMTLEEIYVRLASRVRHYMIDEFQDTNRLQWRIVRPMIDEALSSGGTFFYVGDRKQAIYSFRGGDSRLFDEAQRELSHYPFLREDLTSNWRSRSNIIDFNNHIFSQDNLLRFLQTRAVEQDSAPVFDADETQNLLSVFDGAQQTSGSRRAGGYVSVERVEGKNKIERDEVLRKRVVELVLDVLTRFPPEGIAVLGRDNADVESVTRWLMEAGVAVRSERTSDIRKNRVIRELTAFLKFLRSPIDNAAFAEFLTGDIFAANTNGRKHLGHEFVFGVHRRKVSRSASSYLYMEFRHMYPKEWERLMEPFFKNVGLYPLYELTVSLIAALGVLRHFPDDQAFVMRFLELIHSQEDECPDLDGFLQYFSAMEGEEAFVDSVDHHAVQVMTIHKAKGLGFPAVIVAPLEMNTGSRMPGQMSFVPMAEEGCLRLWKIKRTYGYFSPGLENIRAWQAKEDLAEELNTAYVALTRAQDEMHVLVPVKSGNNHNPAKWLLPWEAHVVGEKLEASASARNVQEPLRLSPSPGQDWISFLKDEFVTDLGESRQDVRRLGVVVHQLLAVIESFSLQDMPRIRKLWETMAFESDASVVSRAKNMCERLLEDPSLRAFFDPAQVMVKNEYELVNRYGDLRRVDRWMEFPTEIWIVDYKMGRENTEADRRQVEDYKSLASDIHPGKHVRGFLIYVQERTFEEVS